MISYHGLRPPSWVLKGVASGEITALCLFAYNVSGPAQLRESTELLLASAREAGRPPPIIGIDQEGGQLMAVTGGVTELPGNMALGAAGSTELAREAGQVLGLELRAMGCNLDFAPVLDVAGDLDSNVVGLRSFGDDPGAVAKLGAALIEGLQSTGLVATAKHFPGHGSTPIDSHHESPKVTRSRGELDAAELVPFRAAIGAGVKAVMSAHIRYPSLDENVATWSTKILQGLLRDELGHDGLVITDAMDMRAVTTVPAHEGVRRAALAGADLVLLGHMPSQPELMRLLAPTADSASFQRVDRVRRELPTDLPPLSLIGNSEHRLLAQRIADRAVTLLPGKRPLPLRLPVEEEVALVTVSAGNLTPADTSHEAKLQLARQLRRRHARVNELSLPYGCSVGNLPPLLASLRRYETVIVATVNAVHDPIQGEMLRALAGSGKSLVHLALRTPADVTLTPQDVTRLCCYGIRAVNTEAAVRVLFGEIAATGRLPVALAGEPPEAPVSDRA